MKNRYVRFFFLFFSTALCSLSGRSQFLLSTTHQNTFPSFVQKSTDIPEQNSLVTKKSAATVEKDIFQWFRTLSEAVHLVAAKHYKEVDIPSFIQDALQAALPKTDPHSSFFSQKSYKAAIESTSGKFSGIGVSIMNKAPEDDTLVVIDVIQGGPSHRAGVQAGDQIVGVDGESLKGLSSDEVITMLRGKVGTAVSLKLLRDKKPIEISVTREVIKDQNLLCYHFKEPNVFYYSLKLFADNTHIQMTKLLEVANKNNYNGLVIDLRRNPGGVLDSAVNMVGLFVKKGSLVVSTRDRNNKTISSYNTSNNPIVSSKKPIFIITDNFTASASEIFAGCLHHYSAQDHENLAVFLVGTETFGKGSVQEVIPISNGCALKLTTMTYILPNDTPIQAKGIKPDFMIQQKATPEKEMTWVNDLYGKEAALKNHIPAKDKEESKPAKKSSLEQESKEELAKNWETRYRKALCTDAQVQACINMVSLYNMADPKEVQTHSKALAFLHKNFQTDDETDLMKIE